jgi:anti-anti-sigma factor
MSELNVEIEAEKADTDSIILHVKGRLYMGTLPKLEEQFEAVAPQCANKKVVLDLYETTYVSSNCWSVFLINARRIKSLGGILLLAGMKSEVLNAYELLELHLFIQNFPNVSAALSLSSLRPSTKIRA